MSQVPYASGFDTDAKVASRSSTVYVVDDDASYLRAVARLLRASGFTVATFPAADAFLKELARDCRGCLITDLDMPGIDGLGLMEAMQRVGCQLPMLFLSGVNDVPAVVRAIRGGAEDFLRKSSSKEELIAAVNRAILRGEEIHSNAGKSQSLRDRLALLSVRERQVLDHVVNGKLNKQIAAELGIHERTVKLHRTNLTGKLRVYSAAELTRLVLEADGFH